MKKLGKEFEKKLLKEQNPALPVTANNKTAEALLKKASKKPKSKKKPKTVKEVIDRETASEIPSTGFWEYEKETSFGDIFNKKSGKKEKEQPGRFHAYTPPKHSEREVDFLMSFLINAGIYMSLILAAKVAFDRREFMYGSMCMSLAVVISIVPETQIRIYKKVKEPEYSTITVE
jgi:hypothetical protein